MKLKEYLTLMENFYNSNPINEKLNFNYDIKNIQSSDYKLRWIVKIESDLYTIDAGKIKEDTWDITFSFAEEGITSLTDKNIPLKVLSAVATAIKKLVIKKNPKYIEATIFGNKKANTFLNLIKHEIKNNKDAEVMKEYSLNMKSKKIESVDYYIVSFKKECKNSACL